MQPTQLIVDVPQALVLLAFSAFSGFFWRPENGAIEQS